MKIPILALAGVLSAAAQTFEVASVKPHPYGAPPVNSFAKPGQVRVELSGLNLRMLAALAYHVQMDEIVNGPPWMDGNTLWDIQAKSATPYTMEQYRTMMQNLLADRFKVEVQRAQKVAPIYRLTAPPSGLKLQHSADPDGEPGYRSTISSDHAVITVTGLRLTMEEFAEKASMLAHRKVVNATGLTGVYDFAFSFSRDVPMDEGDLQPSIENSGQLFMNAIHKHLGLSFERTTGPVDVISIIHAQKPTPD